MDIHETEKLTVQKLKKISEEIIAQVLCVFYTFYTVLFGLFSFSCLMKLFSKSKSDLITMKFENGSIVNISIGFCVAVGSFALGLLRTVKKNPPITVVGFCKRAGLRLVIVLLIAHVGTDILLKGSKDDPCEKRTLLTWFAIMSGLLISDIGVGHYGGHETGFPEAGFAQFMRIIVTCHSNKTWGGVFSTIMYGITIVVSFLVYVKENIRHSANAGEDAIALAKSALARAEAAEAREVAAEKRAASAEELANTAIIRANTAVYNVKCADLKAQQATDKAQHATDQVELLEAYVKDLERKLKPVLQKTEKRPYSGDKEHAV